MIFIIIIYIIMMRYDSTYFDSENDQACKLSEKLLGCVK